MRSRRRNRIRVRTPFSGLVAIAALTVALFSGCSFHASIGSNPVTSGATDSGAADNGTYTGNGVTFRYPTDWNTVTLGSVSAKSQNAKWDKVVGPPGSAGFDFAVVAEYSLSVPITAANLDKAKEPITTTIRNLLTQAGGTLESGPTVSTMGGLPSFEYTGTAKATTGDAVESKMVLAFDGPSEYFVNCQYTEALRQEVLAGCDQIVSSFHTT